MREFDFGTLRIAVDEVEYEGEPFFSVQVQAPGRKVGLLTPPPAPSEAAVALALLQDMRKIFSMGVEPYVKAAIGADPERDEDGERKRASALFAVAQAARDEDLAEAERQLEAEAYSPEMREAQELVERTLSRTFDFGNVKIAVRPHRMVETGQLWFHILMEAPGVRDEDLMLRPPGYPVSRVAQDHIKVIRAVLANGVQASTNRHLKANYLGEEWRPKAEEYIRKLEEVGQAMGDAELARVEEGLEEETGREIEERTETVKGYKEREEAKAVQELEARERQIEARLKELREKRGKR